MTGANGCLDFSLPLLTLCDPNNWSCKMWSGFRLPRLAMKSVIRLTAKLSWLDAWENRKVLRWSATHAGILLTHNYEIQLLFMCFCNCTEWFSKESKFCWQVCFRVSQMETIPNGQNPEWTLSWMDRISNGHNPEWTCSQMNTIPNGHQPQYAHPERTLSQMDSISNRKYFIRTHYPEWT